MKKKLFCLLLLINSYLIFPNTFYVDLNAQGNNSGTSWLNAFTDLQTAINSISNGDILFVKSGIYYPSQEMISGDTRSRSFFINKNIKIYGGFIGTELTIDQRILENNISILSGDFNANDTDSNGNGVNDFGKSENAYSVMTTYGLNNTALLDGFKIYGGNANGGSTYNLNSYTISTSNGGGLHNVVSNIIIKNTKFVNNSAGFGGGICNKGACFPTVENSEFNYNTATYGSGIHLNDATLVTIINSSFFSNIGSGSISSLNNSVLKATNCNFSYNEGTYGGAIYLNNSNGILSNCKLFQNIASSTGGAIYCTSYSICSLYNSLIYRNHANYGGAIYNVSNSYANSINCTFYGNNATTKGGAFYCSVSPDSMNMKLYNTIIYNNTSPSNPNIFWEFYTKSKIHVRNSIIQGSRGSSNWDTYFGTDDANNLDVNPQFVNTNQNSEDFNLQTNSLGVDNGYNSILNLPNGNNSWTSSDKDIYGNSRLSGSNVDIGATEKTTNLDTPIFENNKLTLFYKNQTLLFNDISLVVNKEIYIIDLNGKIVYKTTIKEKIINLPVLKIGMYIVKIEDEIQGKKFIYN